MWQATSSQNTSILLCFFENTSSPKLLLCFTVHNGYYPVKLPSTHSCGVIEQVNLSKSELRRYLSQQSGMYGNRITWFRTSHYSYHCRERQGARKSQAETKSTLCIDNSRSSKIPATQHLDTDPKMLHGKEAALKRLRRREDGPTRRAEKPSQIFPNSWATYVTRQSRKEPAARIRAGKRMRRLLGGGNASG